MSDGSRRVVRQVLLLVGVAAAGWFGGGLLSQPTATGDVRQLPTLVAGDTVPNIGLSRAIGEETRLRSLSRPTGPHVLLILASTCSTCLGELASWNAWAKESESHQVTALVYAPDTSWMRQTTSLIRPVFPLSQITPIQMDSVGTRLTPTAYLLDDSWAIVSVHLGIAETAELRSSLAKGHDQAPSEETVE